VLEPTRAREALAPEVVLGIPAEPDRLSASESALALQEGLRQAYPDRAGLAVVLSGDPRGATAPGEPLPPPGADGAPPVVYTGGNEGPEGALPTLLELALTLGSPACALLEPMPRPPDGRWLRALLDPVLAGEYDLVAPAYARGRFDGVLVSGVVYPLSRALFGHRLRQPLGREIVVSRPLAERLLSDVGGRTDPAQAGADLWGITKAMARECRMAQVYLGPRTVPPPQPTDVSKALARVLGSVFAEMELYADRWQRVRGSRPVPTFGEEHLGGEPSPAPDPAPLVSAFGLGWQDLRHIWSAVLPPQALLALQRIQRDPPEALRMPDALWARVVYDFAIGWRVKIMEREQLLRSMTPLYLGWVASFVNEVAPLGRQEAEARVERLCEAFEAEKPYLISRWRWPDRFSP
jgi:glucosylglycerate synthase